MSGWVWVGVGGCGWVWVGVKGVGVKGGGCMSAHLVPTQEP